MTRYGALFGLADYVGRTIPKKGHAEYASLFVHDVLETVKRLVLAERANDWLQVNFYARDAIWVLYKGQLAFMLEPGQQHLRLVVFRTTTPTRKQFVSRILKVAKRGELFQNTLHNESVWQWRLGQSELKILCDYVDLLPKGTVVTRVNSKSHPRVFPPEVRTAAFEAFRKGGSWCPGVSGSTKRHRLNLERGDSIQYDHILPHSKGGASNEWNVQVLCDRCNSVKRAKTV